MGKEPKLPLVNNVSTTYIYWCTWGANHDGGGGSGSGDASFGRDSRPRRGGRMDGRTVCIVRKRAVGREKGHPVVTQQVHCCRRFSYSIDLGFHGHINAAVVVPAIFLSLTLYTHIHEGSSCFSFFLSNILNHQNNSITLYILIVSK